ncbi:MAG: ABC transporter permease [Candidatus Korarchaeota archaeon]|nr:ABC transporter permease [Candidatus Korarchaeota archaeon]NIU84717.1 ABC transporter permease subunit [Candidatus Thorarchaeota archaeon]NIW14719.1 ABC transporter permease subunit [Candidatus Thorarchaeota archaeon]NIW52793.1 ABC transporter permease subunit [Candidatus Korarchaeota archaeon]
MGFQKYAVRRIITAFITILIVISVNYFIFRLPMYLLGSDPAELYGLQRIINDPDIRNPQKIIDEIRKTMGLPPEDASLWVRFKYFLYYIKSMLTFDFGKTFTPPRRPVAGLLVNKLQYTLLLMGLTVPTYLLIGIWLGVKAGSSQGTKKDSAISSFGLILYSVPSYWIQLLALLLFTKYLPIYPATTGPTTGFAYQDGFVKFLDMLYMFSLPIITLVLAVLGYWVMLMRSSLVRTMTEDYIFTARAKGLDEQSVLYKHALRNAILPVWTQFVLTVSTFWTGVVITESIFSLPGVGGFFYDAIFAQDYPIMEMIFFFITVSVVAANVTADLSYGLLDPRIKYD